MAAIEFHKKNFDNFLVLEAKDYIGGRVKTTMFAGVSVPLGAGWIHRSETNHSFYLLSKEYHMTLYEDVYRDIIYR